MAQFHSSAMVKADIVLVSTQAVARAFPAYQTPQNCHQDFASPHPVQITQNIVDILFDSSDQG